MEQIERVTKSVDFLRSRVRVEDRRVEKGGEGPLRFWDHRVTITYNDDTGNTLNATAPIPAGTLIWTADLLQQSSDILTLDEVLSFSTATQRQQWADYTWAISGLFFGPRRDLPLEEAIALEASHFLNHSCNANVGFVTDTSLMALRDIAPGEMISNDYAMTEFLVGFFPGFECRCGESECRRHVTVNDWRRPELQRRYAGFFTTAVQALIDSVTTDYTPLLHTEPLQRELRTDLVIREHPTDGMGKALFATKRIVKGEMVAMNLNLGRTISLQDVLKTTDPRTYNFYVRFGWQSGRSEFTVPAVVNEELVDAGFFMNHSCDPTVVVFGSLYVAFRDIEAGEEITYDYATTETHFDRIPKCQCGSANCRGAVTARDWQLPELQQRYAPSAWATHIIELMFGRFVET